MAMVSAGRILILPKGSWDNLASYDMLDMVTGSNNKAYLARKASVGVNPTTDDGTYWQMFGSSVAADGTTIVDDGSGNISVNIDGTTIKYDSTNGYLYVDADEIDKAIEDLTNVNISNVSNGQVLVYDSTSQKWKNTTISTTLAGLNDTDISNPTDGQVLKYDSVEQKWVNEDDASGHTIQNASGTDLTQRTNLQFKGLSVSDDSTNNRTIVDASSKADKIDLTSISQTGSTATQTIPSGTYFYLNGSLVRAIADISSGSTFTLNTNYKVVNGALNDVKDNIIEFPNINNVRVSDLLSYVNIALAKGKNPSICFTDGGTTRLLNMIARSDSLVAFASSWASTMQYCYYIEFSTNAMTSTNYKLDGTTSTRSVSGSLKLFY